jgi:hypothetical protein
MNGEPQPADVGDDLDRALFALKTVWFGLFSGAVVIAVTMVAVVFSNDAPIVDLGGFGYFFLLAVPMGFVGAYVLAPMAAPKDPAEIVRSAAGKKAGAMYQGWDATKPVDAYYWYPAYAARFFIRAAMLEGAAIFASVGFLVTSNWVVLGGAVVLIAALVAELPTRGAAEAFAAARQRQASEV